MRMSDKSKSEKRGLLYNSGLITNQGIPEEEYDYMDSLMSDIMGDQESAKPSEEDHRERSESSERAQVRESGGSESRQSEPSKPAGRRIPLFQQVGVIEKKEEAPIEEVSIQEEDSYIIDKDSYIDTEEIVEEATYTEEVLIEEDVVVKGDSHIRDEVIIDSGSYIDDSFDSMLEDLIEDSPMNDEEVVEVESDVSVPLETPEMKSVKVTPDGKTLAEILPSLRGGRKSVNQIVKEIKNEETVVEVDGKKFSDNRYVKHVEVINKEKAEDEKRVSLSNKFLQRNAKFTEQEKIIMKNLGVNSKQFTKLMKSRELTKKEKESLIGLGRYGAEKHFKGRRYRTTVGDTAMLEFLVKFKFANTRILRWISNEPQGRTWRKLDRLRQSGLVESKTIIGVPDLWAATYAGVAVSGYSYEPGLRPIPKMITISSTMGINYIAACLWFNTVNVLNLADFPAENRIISLQEDGRERVRGEMLVSELEIRSSLGKEINPSSSTMRNKGDERLYDVISSNVREEFENWAREGKVGDSPEFITGNEYMWVLYPQGNLTMSYHVPDLVVKRERGPNGEPRSIAIEMERYEKSNDRYDKIMLAYKLDKNIYEKVVWITPNNRVARALERAAKNVGFTRYSIVPIITENGPYKKQDIWMI